jgi:glutamate synthase domain-containing protein 1
MDNVEKILKSRTEICSQVPPLTPNTEEEGGCGVTGFICSIPVTGKNIFEPSVQMHNRGNGKGGGIGAVGFIPEAMGISNQILQDDYMLHIALLDLSVKAEIEDAYIKPFFKIDKAEKLNTIDDHRSIGLEVRPPDVMRYFVRVKDEVLDKFIQDNKFSSLERRDAEDEFVYQNSFKINTHYYASLGEKKAFVMSHGRNMMILKIVGYAENVVKYYKLEDFKAHAWLAHQRYPTRGRVWHPGGCHPFSALHEALVHNGDFANYQSVSEYLKQRNYRLLFLTDTEEAALLLDLWNRVYKYPLEHLIEAMAPTSEMDFDMLPAEKQKLYKAIQTHHVNASPDGPWFFIIARNDVKNDQFQLIGITDTAMLRPQVFALQEGDVQVGLICSEKQAIDATLISLEREDPRFRPIADKYWNARGGSYTDGGSFIFSLKDTAEGMKLICTDKFGKVIRTPKGKASCDLAKKITVTEDCKPIEGKIASLFAENDSSVVADKLFAYMKDSIGGFNPDKLRFCIETIKNCALKSDNGKQAAINALTLLNDRRFNTGSIKRSSLQHVLKIALDEIFDAMPMITETSQSLFSRINYANRDQLRTPKNNEKVLIVDAEQFEPEGDNCDAVMIVKAFKLGWKRFIVYKYRGQRFTGCGFGPATKDVRIDVYGASGDYLARINSARS